MYGLKEQKLARAYVEVLGFDAKKSDGGKRLLGWKQPTGNDHVSLPVPLLSSESNTRLSLLTLDCSL